MAILVNCPSCNRQLRVPDDLLGTRVQCSTCSATFDATGTPEEALRAGSPADAPAEDRPWDHSEEGAFRRDLEPHRSSTVLTLGVISVAIFPLCGIGILLGIPTWFMGTVDLRKIRERTMDPRGETTTRAGWVLGIVGTLLNTLTLLGCFLYIAVVATVATSMAGAPGRMRPAVPKVAPKSPVAPKPAVKPPVAKPADPDMT